MSDDKAVAWQRRQQYSDIPGYVPQWQFVSKEEATGHFERLAGYEYRPLYTRPSEQAVTEAMVDAVVKAIRPYTHDTLFLDEHKILVRSALRAAKEAGRHG